MMNAGNSRDSKVFKINEDRDRNIEIEGGREEGEKRVLCAGTEVINSVKIFMKACGIMPNIR